MPHPNNFFSYSIVGLDRLCEPALQCALYGALDGAFDRACVLKMESLVLRELGWKLNDVVPCAYVPRFLTILGYRPGASDGDHLRLCSRRVLFSHWFPYDRVRVVNFIP